MTTNILTKLFGAEDDLCPICLDPMPVMTFRGTERCTMTCCGNYVCRKCDKELVKHEENTVMALCANNPFDNVEETMRTLGQSMACPMCRYKSLGIPGEKFRKILENAKNGQAWAQQSVAMKYEKGIGVKQNFVQAAYWYQQAAEQGHPWAQFSYGNCLETGNGVDQSVLEAKKWYEKAASVGLPHGQHNLAQLLLKGTRGITKDETEAIRLLQLGADQGYDVAQCSLGNCYSDAMGVPKDYDKAMYWYEKAAEQGSSQAMNNIAATLMRIAVDKYGSMEITGKCPIPRAIKWARMAAAKGEEHAIGVVEQLEAGLKSDCANCRKLKPANDNLLRCSRCKLMHYCSRDCQVKHWRAGHKKDCCE